MRDYSLYEHLNMSVSEFPIIFACNRYDHFGEIFPLHWHEHLEFLYFVQGEANIYCSSIPIHVKAGDLITVNSNELHSGESLSDELVYYAFIVNISMLHSSSLDTCETKYIAPITQNLILFKNKVYNDLSVNTIMTGIIKELEQKETGYELAVKSSIYNLLVFLLRNHVQEVLSKSEFDARIKNLKRFNGIIKHIEENYVEDISSKELAEMVNLSYYHFCRLFKEITGKAVTDHINLVRIKKAEILLRDTEMNITEVASSVGFDDINYFSRLFKKYKKISPSCFRKN